MNHAAESRRKPEEQWTLADIADVDGVLRVRIQPGPNMRWFEQGVYIGLGLMFSELIVALIIGLVVGILILVFG